MLFNSYVFLFVFFPVAFVGFFACGRRSRPLAGAWLVVASFVFYGWFTPFLCLLLGISIAFNYGTSLLIERTETQPRWQSLVLTAGIAVNLTALIYYKYLAWLVGLLDTAGIADFAIPTIVLPLGISFFTFTQIGYLADCATGVAKDRNPLNYMLFVTFFPHLIAGPILHNQEIMAQFANRRTFWFSAANFAIGSGIFVVGLLKKCLLADPVSAGVASAFAHPEGLTLVPAWQAAMAYSLQLYFDFSGYTDMAIGLARMFNIKFPLNFNSPYKASSVIEYWQRWHMTLTRYLIQYVYTPIAISVMRRRRAKRLPINRAAQKTVSGFTMMIALPITVTMALAGIWHGSGGQFLIFGLLHAFYLCVNHAWRVFVREPTATPSNGPFNLANIILTYLCVLVGSVFFRAPSIHAALSMLGGMSGLHGLTPIIPSSDIVVDGHIVGFGETASGPLHGLIRSWGRIAMLYVIVWGMPNTQQLFANYFPSLEPAPSGQAKWWQWRMSAPWAIAVGCGATLAVLSIGGTSEFLYFQF
jgi:alginate O-acetyltransferase complex protein AlgI